MREGGNPACGGTFRPEAPFSHGLLGPDEGSQAPPLPGGFPLMGY